MGIDELFDGIARVVERFSEELAEQRLLEKMLRTRRGPKVRLKKPEKEGGKDGPPHQIKLIHNNLLFANALPEWDFKYLSNDRALVRSLKATYVINSQGLYFDVWGDWP